MDGAVITAADVNKIADLESREVLLAKLAGLLKAQQSQAAALFAAPLAQAARVFGALQAKRADEPQDAAPVETPAEASAETAPEAPASDAPEAAAAEEPTEG